ncbi:MAG: hypothetical protein LUG83_07945 [Lachnospiraceae bacterium]|nr:hypothetical protein [Lachnospiraceae bacterium]
MSGTNFRGVRKLSPKPSAFESEIHPPHKPSVYATGYFALPGANPRRREFIHAPQRTGRMDDAAFYGFIQGEM